MGLYTRKMEAQEIMKGYSETFKCGKETKINWLRAEIRGNNKTNIIIFFFQKYEKISKQTNPQNLIK